MIVVVKKNGFSLVEILCAMTVLGILMLVSVPSFTASNFNNRLISETNQLSSAFSFARAEAYRRNDFVSVCATTNYTECNSDDFSTGIIVFRNTGQAGLTNENQILKVYDKWQADDKGIITVNDGTSIYTYNAVPQAVSAGTILVCAPSYNSFTINVNAIGSLNIVENDGDGEC